jgi:hypothetical protein
MHPLFFLSLSQENLFKFNTVLFKIIKDKVMAFADIFKDTNDYNEKTIIGFLSFAVMVLVMIADVVSGFFGKDLVINEFTYNSFVIVTLGSFGIAGLEKFAKK